MNVLEPLQTSLGLDTSGFHLGLDKALRSVKDFATSLTGAFTISVAAIGGLGTALYGVAKKAAAMGGEFNDLSSKTGMSVEFLSRMKFVAETNAASLGAVTGAIGLMTNKLGEAKQGAQPAIDAFAKLGISQEQLQSFRGGEDAFVAVRSALSKIEDPFARAAIAQDIFGRGSKELGAILNMTNSEWKMAEEAAKRYAEMSTEDAKAAEDFNTKMTELNSSMDKIAMKIGVALMPAFMDLAEVILDWIANNDELLSQDLPAFAERLGAAFGVIADAGRIVYGIIQVITAAILTMVAGIMKVVVAGDKAAGWAGRQYAKLKAATTTGKESSDWYAKSLGSNQSSFGAEMESASETTMGAADKIFAGAMGNFGKVVESKSGKELLFGKSRADVDARKLKRSRARAERANTAFAKEQKLKLAQSDDAQMRKMGLGKYAGLPVAGGPPTSTAVPGTAIYGVTEVETGGELAKKEKKKPLSAWEEMMQGGGFTGSEDVFNPLGAEAASPLDEPFDWDKSRAAMLANYKENLPADELIEPFTKAAQKASEREIEMTQKAIKQHLSIDITDNTKNDLIEAKSKIMASKLDDVKNNIGFVSRILSRILSTIIEFPKDENSPVQAQGGLIPVGGGGEIPIAIRRL